MRHLQTLLEILRNDGYVVTLPGNSSGTPARWIEELPREREWDLFEKVEPFVFSPGPAIDNTLTARIAEFNWQEGYDHNSKIDAPFPVFSVEHLDGSALDFFTMRDGSRRETIAILVIEILPKQYGYYTLCQDTGGESNFIGKPSKYKVFKSNTEGPTVAALLERLNRERMGVETVRTVVKLGHGKSKRSHRIRRIVHVSPKHKTRLYSDVGRNVDWTHRWEVRGHWREFNGLGKDREGNYCIHGHTWVVHHEKGPEHLPLVKKVRLVE